MLKVGLTGGISSGKSTVANIFSDLGIPIIDSDQIALEITEPGQPAYHRILEKFGPDILLQDKRIDRKKLRLYIFSNPELKHWLEQLLHPIIKNDIQQKTLNLNAPYCIIVIPLLVEANARDLVDRVLVVDAGKELQIMRTMQRDDTTAEQAEQILAAQATSAERLAIADDVIYNNDRLDQLVARVQELDKFYRELS